MGSEPLDVAVTVVAANDTISMRVFMVERSMSAMVEWYRRAARKRANGDRFPLVPLVPLVPFVPFVPFVSFVSTCC